MPENLLHNLTELSRIYAGIPVLGVTLKEAVEWMKTLNLCTSPSETPSDTSD